MTPNNTTPRGAFTRQTAIQGVGLAGAGYVQPGVVDQSGWFAGQAAAQRQANDILDLNIAKDAVTTGINTAAFVGKGLVLDDVNRDVQDLVDNYTSTINGPTEAMGLDNLSTSLWNNLGDKSKPSNITDINTVEQKHAETLTKLQKAYKQGAITSLADLEARALKVTREAVNRTPGLAQEIMGQTQQVLHLSGVRGMVNPLEEAGKIQAKQQAQIQKKMLDYAFSKGIPFDYNNPDFDELGGQISSKMRQENMWEQAKRVQTMQTSMDEAQSKNYLRHDFNNVFSGALSSLHDSAGRIFAPGANFAQAISEFRDVAEQHRIQLQNNLRATGALNIKGGNLTMNNVNDAIGNVIKQVEKSGSLEDAAKQAKNLLNITSDHQNLQLMKKVNVHFLNAVNKMSDTYSKFQWKTPENMTISEGIFNAISKGILQPDDWDSMEIRDGVSNVTSAVGGLVLSDQPEAVSQAFGAVARSMGGNTSPAERVTKLTGYFSELAKTDYKGRIKQPDPEFSYKFTQAAEAYLSQVGTMFQRGIANANTTLGLPNQTVREGIEAVLPGTSHVLGPTKELSARGYILPNGLVGMETTNDAGNKYQDQFYNDVAKRYNDVIKTYANIANVSYKEASDLVLSRFGNMLNIPQEELPNIPSRKKQTLGTRGQNENNPLNLKEVGKDRFRSDFVNKKEGILASYKQLLKYHDGSSSQVEFPLTTPELMLRKWNNQNEKGSASDSQYANNVANYSGLNLKEPIDKNDVNSWADLLYGMAKAEGAKNITRSEIRASLSGG